MRSTPRRRSESSHSRRISSGRRLGRGTPSGWSCQTIPHFVKTYGRSDTPFSARATTSSEWPRP